MKLNYIYIYLFILLFSCHKKTESAFNEQLNLSYLEKDNKFSKKEQNLQLDIKIPDSYSVKEVYNVQLDSNKYANQIIIAKAHESDSFLKVLFVDLKLDDSSEFTDNEDVYFLSLESKILASSINNLNFYSLDLENDGNVEPIFIGKDKDNNSTKDVFKKGKDDKYKLVFSNSVDGSIKIQEKENAKDEFEILFYRKKENGKTEAKTYFWNDSTSQFESTYSEKSKIDDNENSSIFQDLWVLEKKSSYYAIEINKKLKHLIVFKDENGIKSEEDYKIMNYISSGNRFIFYLENGFIKLFIDRMDLYIKKDNKISVSFKNSTDYNGTYKRAALKKKATQKSKPKQIIKLNGMYNNNEGLSLVFSNNTFTKRESNDVEKGTYLIYKIGKNVIDFQSLDKKEIKRKTYIINFSQEKNENIIIKKIRLIPAHILVSGIEELSGKELRLEQIVILDKNKNQSEKQNNEEKNTKKETAVN